jgi:hypothetical protein
MFEFKSIVSSFPIAPLEIANAPHLYTSFLNLAKRMFSLKDFPQYDFVTLSRFSLGKTEHRIMREV